MGILGSGSEISKRSNLEDEEYWGEESSEERTEAEDSGESSWVISDEGEGISFGTSTSSVFPSSSIFLEIFATAPCSFSFRNLNMGKEEITAYSLGSIAWS